MKFNTCLLLPGQMVLGDVLVCWPLVGRTFDPAALVAWPELVKITTAWTWSSVGFAERPGTALQPAAMVCRLWVLFLFR
jgi:hypothetical protein